MTREGFWRVNHLGGDSFWLTGTRLDDLLTCYELSPPESLCITEIGVGLRYATKELAKLNRVTAVDIVEEAIAPTRAYATALLTGDLRKAPPADLVFCHLVFQHCDSAEVGRLLHAPLKQGGVFACQTVYLLGPDEGGWDPLRIVWHPREEVLELARSAGLAPIWENAAETKFDGARIGVSYLKCRKDVA